MCCQIEVAGIYSVPSLGPPLQKVRQVEIEAGDCEGRLPLLFEYGLGSLALLISRGDAVYETNSDQRPKTQDQRPNSQNSQIKNG